MEFLQHIEKAGSAVREKAVKNRATNIWFRASTPAVDRYGEMVRSTGIKIDNFIKNPIFGWSHKVYGGMEKKDIIGKVVDFDISEEAFDVEVEFIPTAGLEDGTGYSYLDMVKGGFLGAVSIGFSGIKFSMEKIKESMVRVWDETDLLEVSLVGIPANPETEKRSLDLGFEQTLLNDFTNHPAPLKDADTAERIRQAFMAHKIRNGMKL